MLDRIGGPDRLSELERLGAQLILQRAVDEEMAIFPGLPTTSGYRLRFPRPSHLIPVY